MLTETQTILKNWISKNTIDL